MIILTKSDITLLHLCMALTQEIMNANEERVLEVCMELKDSYEYPAELTAHLDRIHQQFSRSISFIPVAGQPTITS